ncbi:MAG: threonine synthase [Frankiaceae bacterium]|jgi:threonine synthase|nr:threonine synthase [Frankiaceae bacterium]
MTATLTDLSQTRVTGLRCRECGTEYPADARHVCELCFGPLGVAYDHSAGLTREAIEAGPHTMWRYAPLLPSGSDPAERVDLGAGWTPLVRARNLGRVLGIRELWVKDDSANPTHSFKDRVVSVAATRARELGFTTLACASTGNLANSVAAHAARAGLRAVVFVPSDLEAGKIVTTAVYGQTLVAVDGNYDDVNRLCSEVADDLPWAFVNVNLRPYYAEGSKTIGYEVAEQLGWRLPGQVVIPVASGSLLTKVDAAFGDLVALGLVDEAPYRIFGAQATGCSPVATAFANGWDAVRPVRPSTIAKSLAIGNPADGPYALDVARRTGGAIGDVPDDEVVAGIRLLAETEGIFGETAGGVTVGTLRRLLRQGRLDPDVPTVIVNTGDGLKTLDAVAPVVGPTVTIPPSLDAFRAAGLAEENR